MLRKALCRGSFISRSSSLRYAKHNVAGVFIPSRDFASKQFQKHAAILEELGLSEVNDGVFADGKWSAGSGPTVDSINPAYNEPIASVKTVTPSIFEITL